MCWAGGFILCPSPNSLFHFEVSSYSDFFRAQELNRI